MGPKLTCMVLVVTSASGVDSAAKLSKRRAAKISAK
jgi:hypothetical protein